LRAGVGAVAGGGLAAGMLCVVPVAWPARFFVRVSA
jgi:hypothetical protein